LSFIDLNPEEIGVVQAMAKELTGATIDPIKHSVIFQNVRARMRGRSCLRLIDYLQLVDRDSDERGELLSALTIHTTSWFREELMLMQVESILQKRATDAKGAATKLKILSAACSTGEEVYSIAAIGRSVAVLFPHISVEVCGWDVDPVSLKKARRAEYRPEASSEIPERFRSLLLGGDVAPIKNWMVPEFLKRICSFRVVNIAAPVPQGEVFDIILCRNMLIYFDAKSIDRIMTSLRSLMHDDSRLLVGVSEVSVVSPRHFTNCGNSLYEVKQKQIVETAPLMKPKAKPSEGDGNAILVVDDEPDLGEIYETVLTGAGFNVVCCTSAASAMTMMKSINVGLIISDLVMPQMNGLQFLKHVRKGGYKGAFVLVSGNVDANIAKEALSNGCDDVILKPIESRDLIRLGNSCISRDETSELKGKVDLVLLGASTGGTEVLVSMLRDFPKNGPPVLVVQHITHNMAGDFAKRLADTSGLTLGQMKNDEVLQRGHLYIALHDYHIGVKKFSQGYRLQISFETTISNHRPSVDFLFNSASVSGAGCAAALMTGMGRDGADGMLALKNAGARTFAQNESTSMVFGMPKEAIKLGCVDIIASPDEISKQIRKMVG
jgi:two-component system chemotaxis response regulator CheB